MSESVRPSSSRTAMSIAFKKARRKFPKNFGLASNRFKRDSSENEESSSCQEEPDTNKSPALESADATNDKTYEKSIQECTESELIDAFKEVKLSEEPSEIIIADHCQEEPENFIVVDTKLDRPILDDRVRCVNVCVENPEFADDYQNELPAKPDPSSYTYHETRQDIGLIWQGESDHCDNYESDIEETPPSQPSHTYTEETAPRRKRQSHRRRKTSSQHCSHRSDYNSLHREEEAERFECNPTTSCSCHEHCAHCQHYYRHCGCCSRAHHCCCLRCCLIWQERSVGSCPSCCRRRRSSKKKRCSTCNGKRRSSGPSIPCSRGDSGIFTQTRYEDYDDVEEEYEDDAASTTLMHKDSLSILQEKYIKRNGRLRKDEDDARKTCKRLSSRYFYY